MVFTEFWKKGYYVNIGGSRHFGGNKQMLRTIVYKLTVYCQQITRLTVYLFRKYLNGWLSRCRDFCQPPGITASNVYSDNSANYTKMPSHVFTFAYIFFSSQQVSRRSATQVALLHSRVKFGSILTWVLACIAHVMGLQTLAPAGH